MATQKQIEANRRNALRSTGPRTLEGKLRSRANSFTHGMTGAIHVPLPHENPADYHEMRAGLIESYAPANIQEQMLIDMICAAWVRLQRAARWETELLDAVMWGIKRRTGKVHVSGPTDHLGCVVVLGDPESEPSWTKIERYRRSANSDYHRATETLRKMQKERMDRPAKELRLRILRENYLKRTVADVTPIPAPPVASVRQTDKVFEFPLRK